jgi:hypothetical protein
MIKKYLFQVNRMNSLRTLVSLLLALSAGCRGHRICEPAADYYYLNPNKDLSAVGRTALLELANDSSYPQISADVTEAIFQAMQKKQKFGLTVVRQNDPAWRSLPLELNTAYTFEQLSAMRNALKADAVLIGAVTSYKPYPHMSLGLRLKLIDLSDGQLLWALEQVWDTTDKTTKDKIKSYYDRNIFHGSDTMEEKLGIVSSLKFIKFVACEIAESLQSRR